MANDYINVKINIANGSIYLTVDEWPTRKVVFDVLENDSSVLNIRIELGIAKVFHKVLEFIKNQSDLFQKEDFELLGEMLSKILFGKIVKNDEEKDDRELLLLLLERDLDITNPAGKKCRLYLEFDQKSGVAMLPWEYILYKTRGKGDTKSIYLSANFKSRFQLIRRVKDNAVINTEDEKLYVMVLPQVEGNKDVTPNINSRTDELPKVKQVFERLKKNFPETMVVEYIESVSFNNIKSEVERIYSQWEIQNGKPVNYILHYLGHSILDNQIGKLVIKNDNTGKPEWVEDRKFAGLFNPDNLDVKQPALVCFQACDSAKIGSINDTLRGVAFEFTKINIPAVVGIQNLIDTPSSNAFFEIFYESLLKAYDVSEATTIGRDFLGRKFNIYAEPYINNTFGSPVLFITTLEPVRLIKPKINPELIDKSLTPETKIIDIGRQKTEIKPDGLNINNPGIELPSANPDKVNPGAVPSSVDASKPDNALNSVIKNQV